MKKLLFVALAAVGMAACVQNEELAVVKSDAIAFDNLYVNNATKADPSLTLANLEKFQVWGWMGSENGTVFTGDEVRKSGSAWIYDNTQYWVPEKNYYFEAVAPANGNWEALTSTSANLTGVKFTNVSGEEDLLYAEYSVTTPNKATLTNGAEKVKLQFGHLLSKVQFSFKNGFTTNNVTVKVKNVAMTAPAEATVALNEKNWTGHNGELTLAFGSVETLDANATGVAADQRLTIPAGADQVYTVTFKVDVIYGAEQALVDQEITSTISGYALEVGKAYNFTAVVGPQVFDMQPIEFTVVGVDEWEVAGNGNAANGTAISTVDELKAAVANGGHYALVADLTVDADETLTVAAGKTVALDLYSHSIVAESDLTDTNRNLFDVRGTLSITNTSNELTRNTTGGVISVKHVGTNMGWGASTNVFNVTAGGELNLDGVAVKNLGGSDMAFAVHLNNWGECTLNVNNSTLESTYIAVRVFNSGNDMNNVTIKNSTLKGKYCFWVHNYKPAGDGVGTDATLNLNIYNGGEQNSNNVFDYSSKAPVLFGFNNPIYYNEEGFVPVYETNAENKEVIVEQICILDVDTVTNNGQVETKYVYGVTGPSGLKWISKQLNSVSTRSGENQYVVNGNTVKLLADIDLTGVTTNGDSFAPIGRYCSGQGVNAPFTGHFDGQGHTIKGIYQSGWDFGYEWGTTGYLGLFGYVVDATIENLTIEGLVAEVEGGTLAAVAGRADGKCVFKNITVKNCKLGTYNNRCGGIVGWTGYYKNEADETVCDFTFENINICDDVVLGGLWGSFDSSIGGVMGQLNSGATNCLLKNVTVSCRIDAYNDCTASYDYYLYRMCGMLIGQMSKTTTIDGSTYPDVAAYGITFDNVTVNYGKWMNYHYCEPTPGLNGGRGMRVEPGFAYDGLPADFDHTQCVDNHYNCIPFDQLFGGVQTACKGVKAWEGVTVNYPAEYTCPLCGQQHNVK